MTVCVGVCRLESAGVADVLARQALARDCPRFSSGRYQAAEQDPIEQGAAIRESYEQQGYCRKPVMLLASAPTAGRRARRGAASPPRHDTMVAQLFAKAHCVL
jgi:hypothetical protein